MIENLFPLPHRCTPDSDGILHNIFPFFCPRVDGEASAHKGDSEHQRANTSCPNKRVTARDYEKNRSDGAQCRCSAARMLEPEDLFGAWQGLTAQLLETGINKPKQSCARPRSTRKHDSPMGACPNKALYQAIHHRRARKQLGSSSLADESYVRAFPQMASGRSIDSDWPRNS